MPLPVLPDVTATIRRTPEDFVVEELPAYGPNGQGEHLYVVVKKTSRTTIDVVKDLARALGVDARGAGYAGMKDRHAIATQALTFPFPIARDPTEILALPPIPGVEILSFGRHGNKLKPGHLVGNRFQIVLRDVPAAAAAPLARALESLAARGVPNAFGPQRFGRDGENPERALGWVEGRSRGPRDRREQRLLFSALQSFWFNAALERRAESFDRVLPGDVAKKHDTGGLFDVPLEGPELEEAERRAATLAISATGPMFGAKMRWPNGEPLAIERAVLGEALSDPTRLEAFRHLGEGTRRVLRIVPTEFSVSEPSTDAAGKAEDMTFLVARFVLPKGAYATTVLGAGCVLRDAAGRGAESPEGSTDAAELSQDET